MLAAHNDKWWGHPGKLIGSNQEAARCYWVGGWVGSFSARGDIYQIDHSTRGTYNLFTWIYQYHINISSNIHIRFLQSSHKCWSRVIKSMHASTGVAPEKGPQVNEYSPQATRTWINIQTTIANQWRIWLTQNALYVWLLKEIAQFEWKTGETF